MTRDERRLLNEKYGEEETAEYEADRKRLASGEPLAYVIGWQPFLGLKIFLDSRPLIPRPETEWWTEKLIANLGVSPPSGGEIPKLKFLDLCAGSGAIGCAALARLPEAQVYFGEIDPAHEATILKNIRENGLEMSRASVYIGDLFEPFKNMKFDIIAANPPYVPSGRALPASVADYEPALALRAGADGLDCLQRMARELKNHLADNGTAWIECDSESAAAAAVLFREQGFQALIRTDQYGKPRIIVVHPIRDKASLMPGLL